MTKAKISEYDAVAANNTDVNGVNIAENCPPSGMNNMGREIMAALKRFQTGADGDSVTVGGSLVVSNTLTAGPVSATTLNTSGAVVFNDAGADVDFRVEGDTDANLLFVDASADAVGIGTSSPNAKLNIIGSADPGTIRLGTSKTDATRKFGSISTEHYSAAEEPVHMMAADSQASSTELYIGGAFGSLNAVTSIRFHTAANNTTTGGTERATITSGGYFKASNTGSYVNATSSYHEFVSNVGDWTAFVRNSNASPSGIAIDYNLASPNNTGNHFLFAQDSTTSRVQLRSNGGIANYTANDVNLSDERVKKDIADLGSQWNCIKEWNLVEFRYREQSEDAPKNYGVIAQQIQEHCPEVVTVFQEAAEAVDAKEAVLDEEGNVIEPAVEARPAKEERIGVREQQMLWMSIKALQEAMERIETLEAKVAALEANNGV